MSLVLSVTPKQICRVEAQNIGHCVLMCFMSWCGELEWSGVLEVDFGVGTCS